MTREQKLNLIWNETHRDFRSTRDGCRSILVLREGGTHLVPLDCLTEAEIVLKLAKKKFAEKQAARERAAETDGTEER